MVDRVTATMFRNTPSARAILRFLGRSPRQVPARGTLTQRERFLADAERWVPWDRLLRLISLGSPSGAPAELSLSPLLLRIFLAQHWFGFGDAETSDAIRDSVALQRFLGIDGSSESLPDQRVLTRFRVMLTANHLIPRLVAEIDARLAQEGLCIQRGISVNPVMTEKYAAGTEWDDDEKSEREWAAL